MNSDLISTEHAYLAMYEYLVELYERTKSDEIGALLGGMSYLNDGRTADPAAWADWIRCVKKVGAGSTDPNMHLSPR